MFERVLSCRIVPYSPSLPQVQLEIPPSTIGCRLRRRLGCRTVFVIVFLGLLLPRRLRFACVSARVSPVCCLRLASLFHRFVAYLMTCLFHRNCLPHLACIHEPRFTPTMVYAKPRFTPHTLYNNPGLHQAAVAGNLQTKVYTKVRFTSIYTSIVKNFHWKEPVF